MKQVLESWMGQEVCGAMPTALIGDLQTSWIALFQGQHILPELATSLGIGVLKVPKRSGKQKLMHGASSLQCNSANRPLTKAAWA